MKANETDFLITTEGRTYRRDVTYRELDPGDAMQKAFNKSVVTRIRNIVELPGHGPCHVTQEGATGIQYWSVPLYELVLRTTFAAREGELYPTFAHKDSTEVPMEVVWNKEAGVGEMDKPMALRFVGEVAPSGENGYYVRDHYLYAFDERKAAYRLPLGNLYENCRLCMGEYDSSCSTAVGSLILALKQFRAAPWNSDLFSDEELIPRFFHFKPLEKGFMTLPILEDWTVNCNKVSTGNLKYIEV